MKNTKKIITCLYAAVFAASAMASTMVDSSTSTTSSDESIRSNECTIQFDGKNSIKGHEYIKFDTKVVYDKLRITKVTINEQALDSSEGFKVVTLVIPGDVKGRETSVGEQAFEGLKSKNLNLKVRFENTNGTKVLLGDCSNLFEGSDSIIEIDLSGADSSGTTSAQRMFCGCRKLESVKFGDFSTYNVHDMSYMFQGCANLKNLDLSSFNTWRVKNMKHMFYGCTSLTSLNLSEFNTENVRDTSYMFFNCINLTNLDVSNFDVSKVTNMSWMFSNCESIKGLDLSSFGRDNTDLSGFSRKDADNFRNMKRTLKTLSRDQIDVDMEGMFYGCSSLVKVNLTNFNPWIIIDAFGIFKNCSSLKQLYCLPTFLVSLRLHDGVFDGCDESLREGFAELVEKILREMNH